MSDLLMTTPTGVFGSKTDTRYTRLYSNQFFDYLSEQLPRNVKEMFRWCELVYSNSPLLVNGIKKLINYPITDFTFKTEAEGIKQATKELLDALKIETHLIQNGLEYYIYGNSFRSMYIPFTRFLICKSCGHAVNVRQASFKIKKFEFVLKCPNCSRTGIAEIRDDKIFDLTKIRIISWNPKSIELSTNPVTGDKTIYYTLSPGLLASIMRGDVETVATVPKVYFEAARKSRAIDITKNTFHFSAPSLAGMQSGWGISPLVPCLKLYLYISILRKAVEAIGLEHITPQRILFPERATTDPSVMSQMSAWKEQMYRALQMWRVDPNYVMLAPIPTGVVNVGSQGRALMPTNEIKAAEEEMLRALDIPPEFIMGTTNLNNSGVSLRLMENQLRPYIKQLEDFLDWVVTMINAHYGKNYCQARFTPFTLSDDVMQRQLLLSATQTGMASRESVQEALRLDPDTERERMKKEQLDNARLSREVQEEIHKMENDPAAMAADAMAAQSTGTIGQYDQQQIINHAQQLAQQLATIPYEERKSQLAQMQEEDFILWALVTKFLERVHEQNRAERKAEGSQPIG
ncbi:MAG: hypothetical protein LHW56_01820 [Candidatus Cloacimonetes bacterium]|nr:hypothetical protein [Candidatus Cloacimonadota bacterium]MDY0171625.1 hypothetical protein [Candidatus Cloacimonadaceae bacterium]